MRLTSKNAALVKTNNNSIFKSKASFDLHSHHAGNKYLDSHNNRQAGPGVGIVSAKWNTKQSQSKPLGFFDILFMISDDQIKNLHEQDIYDHMAINRTAFCTSRDHFTRLNKSGQINFLHFVLPKYLIVQKLLFPVEAFCILVICIIFKASIL